MFLFTIAAVVTILYCSYKHRAKVEDPEIITAEMYEFEQPEGKWV